MAKSSKKKSKKKSRKTHNSNTILNGFGKKVTKDKIMMGNFKKGILVNGTITYIKPCGVLNDSDTPQSPTQVCGLVSESGIFKMKRKHLVLLKGKRVFKNAGCYCSHGKQKFNKNNKPIKSLIEEGTFKYELRDGYNNYYFGTLLKGKRIINGKVELVK